MITLEPLGPRWRGATGTVTSMRAARSQSVDVTTVTLAGRAVAGDGVAGDDVGREDVAGAGRARADTVVRDDEVIVEAPLTVQVDGTTMMTTMRTPGHDWELALGWCHAEGIFDHASLVGVRWCDAPAQEAPDGPRAAAPAAAPAGTSPPASPLLSPAVGDEPAWMTAAEVVAVDTDHAGDRGVDLSAGRLGLTTSSCGLCGADLVARLADRLSPLPMSEPMSAATLIDLCSRVRSHQELFASTGGVHAAAAFRADGEIMVVREDVGRHNALDKVVGRLLLDGVLPATGLGVYVSGRASFELVQKAWAAGFTTMVSVSAPSALAVDTARRAGLRLAGFVRTGRLNLYAPAP